MSKQKDAGSSLGDRLLAGLFGVVACAVGFYMAPLLVKASIVAGLALVIVGWSVARASGLSIREMVALLVGKALVAGFKGLAIALVEWPLRAAHRVAARFELRLRLEVVAARCAYRFLDGAAVLASAAAARTRRVVSTQTAPAAEALADAVDGERVDDIRESA